MIKVFTDSEKQGQQFNEYITKKIQDLKQNQFEILDMKNTIQQFKYIMRSLINRMSEAEEKISEPEYTSFKNTQLEIWKRNYVKLTKLSKN